MASALGMSVNLGFREFPDTFSAMLKDHSLSNHIVIAEVSGGL